MSDLPGDLKYSNTHEWVRDDGEGQVTVGITDHAQELLGDLVFVDLPETGTRVEKGGECAVVDMHAVRIRHGKPSLMIMTPPPWCDVVQRSLPLAGQWVNPAFRKVLTGPLVQRPRKLHAG